MIIDGYHQDFTEKQNAVQMVRQEITDKKPWQ